MPREVKFEWEFDELGRSKGVLKPDGLTRADCDVAIERLYKLIAAVKSVKGRIPKDAE
jgi:uncharacterized protein YjhX (UPF0386 family)